MGPAHLVTTDSGTNELTRVHFHDGHFQLGGGNDRIGVSSIMSAEYVTDGPIVLRMHDRRVLVISSGVIASVTYTEL